MKRYEIKTCGCDYILESPTGEWVKWEDVEILDRSFTASEAKRHELEARIKELTQGDPAWYDASPAFAFQLLAQYKADIKVLSEDLLKAHKNIAAGSGYIKDGEVNCTCQACEVARRYVNGN